MEGSLKKERKVDCIISFWVHITIVIISITVDVIFITIDVISITIDVIFITIGVISITIDDIFITIDVVSITIDTWRSVYQLDEILYIHAVVLF